MGGKNLGGLPDAVTLEGLPPKPVPNPSVPPPPPPARSDSTVDRWLSPVVACPRPPAPGSQLTTPSRPDAIRHLRPRASMEKLSIPDRRW